MAERDRAEFNVLDVRIRSFMLEVTTVVECRINCRFCPQKIFLSAYKSPKRTLSFEDFKKALDKIPEDVIIIFAGFAEPYLNKDCTKMLLHAHKKGHPVSIFTTGTGMTLEDVALIKDIPFHSFPHGGFVLHLPDDEGFANIKIDDTYLQVLQSLKEAGIQNFRPISMGSVHGSIRHIFPRDTVKKQEMNSRAGNLNNESLSASYASRYHKTDVICGRDEYLYNNVMLPNGDIVLCCQDYGMKHILGNIYEKTYEEIVPDPLASYELCKNCTRAIELPINFPKFRLEKKR